MQSVISKRSKCQSSRFCRLEALEPRQLLSDTWSTLVDIPGASANSANQPTAVAIDQEQNVYVGGTVADSSGTKHLIIQKRSAVDGTWSVYEDLVGQYTEHPTKMTSYVDPATQQEYLVVASEGDDTAGRAHWIVLKGPTNQPNGMTVIDDYQLASGNSSYAASVAWSGSTIYVGGTGSVTTQVTKNQTMTTQHWLVRRSTDGGSTWRTVEDVAASGPGAAGAQGVAIDSSGSVYVTGNRCNSSGATTWVTDRGTLQSNGSLAWATVDSVAVNGNAFSYGIAIDHSGVIYATGGTNVIAGKNQPSVKSWVVRKSSDGTSWSTSDQWTPTGYKQACGRRIAVDPNNNLYVVGAAQDSTGLDHWLVRKFDGQQWSISEDMTSGKRGWAQDVVADSAGNVFAVGDTLDSASIQHWLVQERVAPATTTVAAASPSVFSTSPISSSKSSDLAALLN